MPDTLRSCCWWPSQSAYSSSSKWWRRGGDKGTEIDHVAFGLDWLSPCSVGLALGAPLLLPGLQLIHGSARTTFMDAGFTDGTIVDLVVPALEAGTKCA